VTASTAPLLPVETSQRALAIPPFLTIKPVNAGEADHLGVMLLAWHLTHPTGSARRAHQVLRHVAVEVLILEDHHQDQARARCGCGSSFVAVCGRTLHVEVAVDPSLRCCLVCRGASAHAPGPYRLRPTVPAGSPFQAAEERTETSDRRLCRPSRSRRRSGSTTCTHPQASPLDAAGRTASPATDHEAQQVGSNCAEAQARGPGVAATHLPARTGHPRAVTSGDGYA